MISSVLVISGSLLTHIQTAYAESASTDILFTGTVPVTCAFEGLSSIEQLDPHIVVVNRQANCNEEINLYYESPNVDSTAPIFFSTSSEHTHSTITTNVEHDVITITVP